VCVWELFEVFDLPSRECVLHG